MASFAERHGFRETKTLIQHDSLDLDTRIAIWNVFSPFESPDSSTTAERVAVALTCIWQESWHKSHDERPYDSGLWAQIKVKVLHAEWWEVLDLVEDLTAYLRVTGAIAVSQNAPPSSQLNDVFERLLVSWRFIGSEIAPIDSVIDVEAVTSAQMDTDGIAGARHALDRAISLLADRTEPDYPNSIKESISFVEAVVRSVTGSGQLSAGLKKLEDAGLGIHPALRTAWLKMYGWTSDADGIRHGAIEPAQADQALAKYVLVTCSAFASYLIEEGRKANLI